MADVVPFTGTTVLPLEVRKVLDAAPDDLGVVVVLGRQADGELYLAGSSSDLGEVMILLERAKAFVLRLAESDGGERYV